MSSAKDYGPIDECVLRLVELLREDEVHHRHCGTADPPPGPFPCDCEVPALLRVLLLASLTRPPSES